MQRLSVERLQLSNFRSYTHLDIATGPAPQVLTGGNGAGKTNLLEAVSLLVPGQGLRAAQTRDFARAGSDGLWAIAARASTRQGIVNIGTGVRTARAEDERANRIVRVDGETRGSSGLLGDYLQAVWLTPSMDGLFTGPAADRRQFLDRLIQSLDPGYRAIANRFERAMQSRNRLLADGVTDNPRLEGFEMAMAEAGVAVAAARRHAIAGLTSLIGERRSRDESALFPWASLELSGTLDADLENDAAVDVEDRYLKLLRQRRERDRAAGRTLDGPHRSDLIVGHGPKSMPARLSSSGEQKALLLGLVLAHADFVRLANGGTAPLLLLDEVTAHLDEMRRAALFAEIEHLGVQAWMTGTDRSVFAPLQDRAQFWTVEDGHVTDT